VREFDHEGFMVVSRQGLQLIMMAVCKAMHNAFPIDELFKPWTNSEGQVSFLRIIDFLDNLFLLFANINYFKLVMLKLFSCVSDVMVCSRPK